jgi:hypothetical protein
MIRCTNPLYWCDCPCDWISSRTPAYERQKTHILPVGFVCSDFAKCPLDRKSLLQWSSKVLLTDHFPKYFICAMILFNDCRQWFMIHIWWFIYCICANITGIISLKKSGGVWIASIRHWLSYISQLLWSLNIWFIEIVPPPTSLEYQKLQFLYLNHLNGLLS